MQSNISLLHFGSDEFRIYRIRYQSKEQLAELRQNHNATNSFFRNGNFIYHSPMVSGIGYSEGESVECSVRTSPEITKSLIHHLLFRKILESGAILSEFTPIEFFIPKVEYDLIREVLNNRKKSSKVGYWQGYTVDTRIFKYQKNSYHTIVLSNLFQWKIKISAQEAINLGVDIANKYVELYDQDANSIFKNKRRLLGLVKSHDHENALVILKDETEEYFSLDQLFLESSFHNRQELLGSYLGQALADKNFSYLADTTQNRAGAEARYRDIQKLRSWLTKLEFDNQNGFSFTIGNFLAGFDTLWEKIQIQKPTFIFNINHSQTDTWHDRGLREYGPYSRTNFTPNTPRIAVVFRASKRGQVSAFMGKFRDGLPAIVTKGRYPYSPYGQGFASKYRLSGLEIKPYPVEDETLSSYDKAIRRLLEENEDKLDLVFVESCFNYKELPPEQNPYFFTKGKLLKSGIPSQVVMLENMIIPDNRLVYILNNVSLASYAKIGGVPWVLPSDPNVEHELVIGIGNKVFKEGRFNITRRIVGIATLFSGEGKYILSNTSKDVPYEEYLDELKRSLLLNIAKVRSENNWMIGDTIRLVFHVFKPFNTEEITVIESIAEELQGEFEVLFAYITIAQRHPFLIFDKSQKGEKDFKNYGKFKGIWQPSRMSTLKINDHNCLLQLIGPSDMKSYKQGMAPPVLVKVDENSSFDDIDYLVRQVYMFASISWRGFISSSLPVTLEYANQIAKILGQLRESGNWDSDILPSKLKSKAWFL